MSDFPIQTTSLDELKGGQKPLVSDDRRGNEHCSQVFPLTGRPGKQVDNDQAASTVSPNNANGAASRPSGSVSGINAGSGRAISVQAVDSNNLQGSNKGDHRAPSKDTAKASLAKAADNGGPRQPSGQFANNGKTPQNQGFQSFPAKDGN